MGYSTEFTGTLRFASSPVVEQLAELGTMLGEDVRDHPEWGAVSTAKDFYYIDLKTTRDLMGLEWSGAEKTYNMVAQVNFVITRMRARWPEFGLVGALVAQGEDGDDTWTLEMVDGAAVKKPRVLPGVRVKCPDCDHVFRVNADGEIAK